MHNLSQPSNRNIFDLSNLYFQTNNPLRSTCTLTSTKPEYPTCAEAHHNCTSASKNVRAETSQLAWPGRTDPWRKSVGRVAVQFQTPVTRPAWGDREKRDFSAARRGRGKSRRASAAGPRVDTGGSWPRHPRDGLPPAPATDSRRRPFSAPAFSRGASSARQLRRVSSARMDQSRGRGRSLSPAGRLVPGNRYTD